MAPEYILALDQGTTSSRSILFDRRGLPVASAQREFPQIYPQPGWVEHDPEAIWASQFQTAKEVLSKAGAGAADVAAIGITNQRETVLLWDRITGEALHNAIVWQCRRTATLCDHLRADGLEPLFRERTGLLLDPYFSGTKLRWLLDHIPGARERAARGELCFGTVDAWLLYKLTGRHATDYTNAARTLLFNIHTQQWDADLLGALDIPAELLPEALPTGTLFGTTSLLGGELPITAMIGDQQAALFGQTAFDTFDCKNTYGTGCFLVMNTGDAPVASKNGLLTTIAWGLEGEICYALEGSVFIAGAAIQWLRDELRLIDSAAESEAMAESVEDTGGVYLVPAFTGLGAPHWDMRARGLITGLTRGTGRAHIVRAALESIAFQSADVVRTMALDARASIQHLRVDGGAASNNFLLQFQADLLGVPVERGQTLESTALGAAYIAGLTVGFWCNRAEISDIWQLDQVFEPSISDDKRQKQMQSWADALRRAKCATE